MKSEQKQYQLVSIEEMYELAKTEEYRIPESILKFDGENDPNGECTWHIRWNQPDLLKDHLLVEECVNKFFINWKYTTNVYDPRTIAYMKYLWYHPLVWVPLSEEMKSGRIITGRVAEERFVKRDSELVEGTPLEVGADFEMLDWFAEKLPIVDGTEPIFIDYKFSTLDIIQWYYITRNDIEMLNATWGEDGRFDPSLLIPFDQRIFLSNLQTIAHRHGGAKSAQIVRLFRKDWKRITTMKFFDIGKLTPEQVEEFRAGLFEGMDYYLEQWDAETPKEETPKIEDPKPTKKKPVQQDRTYITFTMSGITVGHIDMLRQKLIQVGWIAKDTLPDDFYKLFSGKTNSTKIIWTGAVGKGMLLFLFQKMVDQGEIVVPDNHSITTILESHFVDEHGKFISGLNSSKESSKHFPIVKECLDILQLEVEND